MGDSISASNTKKSAGGITTKVTSTVTITSSRNIYSIKQFQRDSGILTQIGSISSPTNLSGTTQVVPSMVALSPFATDIVIKVYDVEAPTESDTPIITSPEYSLASIPEETGGGGGAVCFLGNAPVLTPSGYRRIDSLAVGDMVRTADGRDVTIQRVKHQRILAPSATVNPFVIPKGQFGATENLAISPRHAVAVPGRGMVEARELGLRQLPMKAAFDYFNLELPEWDNMVVAGVEVESLAPKKRVVMTAAELRAMVTAQGLDLAKLARFVEMRADGRVTVTMSQKTRRM